MPIPAIAHIIVVSRIFIPTYKEGKCHHTKYGAKNITPETKAKNVIVNHFAPNVRSERTFTPKASRNAIHTFPKNEATNVIGDIPTFA